MTTFTYLVRIKIFNDAGVKKYGTVDLPYAEKERISDITGRTIEPDGSEMELTKAAVFDHVVEKVRGRKTQARSFAMPGVKPGAIIEYRYKKFEDEVLRYVPLDAQMEVPIEHVVFHIKPLDSRYTVEQMQIRAFRTSYAPLKVEADGFTTTHLENIPAFHPEPDSPPYREIQPWVIIYYTPNGNEDADHFWKRWGKEYYQGYAKEVKVNGDVKSIAEEVTKGASSDDEKLAKLYYYCQKHIKDVFGRDVSDAERQSFKPNKNTAETLSRNEGTGRDISLAFLAVAQAAGYDARFAPLMDRETMIFHKEFMLPFFDTHDVAVNVNGKWRFYDPETKWLAAGQVRWQEQYIQALIPDPKDPQFVMVPLTPASESVLTQKGRLALDENGTIEGDLDQTLTGQLAADWRAENIDSSAGEREKAFSETVKSRMPGAEVTQIQLSDPGDPSIPVMLKCHIKMEGYATRTGKRLFFAPAVFQLNAPVRYTEATRRYDVLFQYPWSEVEDVGISYPQGFELENPDLAAPVAVPPVESYTTSAMRMPNRVLYHRAFVFGQNGSIFFGSTGYPVIKKIFDLVHDNDGHMFTLKQETQAAAN